MIRIHPHAIQRMEERCATTDEVYATVEHGEVFPAKFGRSGFRRNFLFDNDFGGRHYHTKQVEVFAVQEESDWVVITVITRFF
jgi:hypothetical protein